MSLWEVDVHTLRPMKSLPRLQWVACETKADTSYNCRGVFRENDPTCLFVYTLSGHGSFSDKSGDYTVAAEQGFLCIPRSPDIAWYYPSHATEPWHFVWVTFQGGNVRDMVDELVTRCGPLYRLSQSRSLVRELMSYGHLDRTMIELTSFESARRVTGLLAGLGESADRHPAEDTGNSLVKWAEEIVRQSIDTPLGVAEIAQRLRVSREHLARVFHQQRGMTLQNYVSQQRMRQAGRMLLETSLSVKEIAAIVGYSKPTNFSRAFQKEIGIVPHRYRTIGGVP